MLSTVFLMVSVANELTALTHFTVYSCNCFLSHNPHLYRRTFALILNTKACVQTQLSLKKKKSIVGLVCAEIRWHCKVKCNFSLPLLIINGIYMEREKCIYYKHLLNNLISNLVYMCAQQSKFPFV